MRGLGQPLAPGRTLELINSKGNPMTARASFTPGFYSTQATASSVAGDWRLGGWTPKVVTMGDEEPRDAQRAALTVLCQALGIEASSVALLGEALREVPARTVLVWSKGGSFADEHPRAWQSIADALQTRAAQKPAFAVVLSLA